MAARRVGACSGIRPISLQLFIPSVSRFAGSSDVHYRCLFSITRRKTVHRTRIIPAVLMAFTVCFSLQAGKLAPVTAAGWGVDDQNFSTLNPSPYGSAPVGSFMQTILDGAGFSQNDGFKLNFANGAFLANDVSIVNYYAWVVHSPDIAMPDGNRNVNVNGDVGGAVFTFTYTPMGPNDPKVSDLHILQLYSQTLNGGPTQYKVDNDGSPGTPFYDKTFPNAVQTDGNTLWFTDEPFLCENITVCAQEGPEDFGGSFSFGVYLVTDDTSSGNNIITVYGGYQWGYTYSNNDTAPEPSTMVLPVVGLLVMIWKRKTRRRMHFPR
jgi:hypothetical protein